MTPTPKRGKALLGVDITRAEIRIVEIQGAWPTPELLHADSTATPAGAFNGDLIARPELIAKALTDLLDKLEITTRTAVIGIPSSQVTTRILEIPNLPDDETLAVVQGEIQHQKIMVTPDYECAFLRILDAEDRKQARSRTLLMVSDQKSLANLKTIAKLADLKLTALEPGLLAMFRCAFATVKTQVPALCIMIGSTVTEIAIVEEGPIRLYRRIEVGSSQLLADLEQPTSTESGTGKSQDTREESHPKFTLSGDLEEVEAPSGSDAREELQNEVLDELSRLPESSALRLLLTELQRSSDFYHREYPDSEGVNSIVVAAGMPALGRIADWLGRATQIPARSVNINAFAEIEDETLKSRLDSSDGSRFIRACGLAMYGLESLPAGNPQFDLLRRDADESKKPQARSHLTAALIFCILLMLGSTVNAIRLNHRLNLSRSQLDRVTAQSRKLRSYHDMTIQELRKQTALREVIHPPSSNLGALADAIVASLPANAALSELNMDNGDVAISLIGDAGADTDLIQLLDTLRQRSEFSRVSLDSLQRDSSTSLVNTLHFQVTVNIH